MTLSSPVAAQDFDKGFAAAEAGDYATALKEWAPLWDETEKTFNSVGTVLKIN